MSDGGAKFRKELFDAIKAKEPDKKKFTFYVSEKVHRQFKKKCKNVAASAVVERLMIEFNKS